MASDIKASILNSDGHGNSLPNGEHKRAPSPGIPDNRRSPVTTNIISNIAIMRARLARIGQATMLLAPRASAVVDVISAQLDELQDIVKNMADNSIRLLLDRPESDWDYNNHAVQHYQATALKRKRETKEDDFPWLVPSYEHQSPLPKSLFENKNMTVYIVEVFPFVPIKKTAVPFDSKLTGAVVIDKVLASVRKKCGKSKDPRLKFKNDTFTLRAPGTCEHIHRDQLVLSSEFVREALFNGRNVNLNLDIKPAEMTHFDPNKSHIDNFVDSLKHSLVDVRTEYKNVRSHIHLDSMQQVVGFEAAHVGLMENPFIVRVIGLDGCTREALPLLDQSFSHIYVRVYLSVDNKILGLDHPVFDCCTNACPIVEHPRFLNGMLPNNPEVRFALYSEIPMESRICCVLYGTRLKEQNKPDTVLGYCIIPLVGPDNTVISGSHEFGLWPSSGVIKSEDAKSVKHADVLWFHGSCVPYANKDLTNPVARIRLKFAEFPVPLIAPPTKLRMKSRPSYLKLHHKDPKSFKVRIIKGTNLAAKDPNGKSDPYVKVYVASLGEQRRKLGSTSRKKETLNPDWTKDPRKATFSGEGTKLEMEVWDHDFFSENDFMGLVEVDLLDPKFDHEPGVPMRFTCKCRQRFSRKDEIVSGSLTFEYTVNIPSSEAKLSKLLRVDLMHNLSKADYDLIWKSRARLFKRPHMLPRLLQKVNWATASEANEAKQLLTLFDMPEDPVMTMLFLGPGYTQPAVRLFAVEQLSRMSDSDLSLYMLQLVQCLKYEAHHDSPLSQFLIRRALRSPYQAGHKLFWTIKAEMSFAPEYQERYQVILEEYLIKAGKHRQELSKQYIICKRFEEVSHQVTQARRTKKKKVVDAMYYKMLHTINEQLLKRVGKFQLPLDPKIELTTLIVEKCKYMSSKMVPLWLVFNNADRSAPPYKVIFKTGDDLRQDILTLQMLEVMNRIWMKDGMDMKLKIYKVLATGKNRHGAGVGLIQVVDQSSTTSDIQAEFGGGALGAFEPTVLVQYLEEHNTDWKHTAKRNFTQSCAGYCVATLVLGIGDRHNGNIMCTKDGHLFHIDFGHFLGNFKSKMGFKRERTPFVFTPEMAKVIGDGKAKSEDYKNFLELCKRAYRLVRQQADLLEMLFILMTSAGMPELVEKSDINYLRNQLNLHMSDSASGKHLETLIEKSRANAYKRLDNFIHIWKHG
mmetsp:Transcript_29445/g.49909  ORF Transcript_29445/g.49909 Transcript_29445/m.49909 type:complete len:1193 (-) Transcript_29445:248-3826(-)